MTTIDAINGQSSLDSPRPSPPPSTLLEPRPVLDTNDCEMIMNQMNPLQPTLLRSKSLNDISNDSQIAAFASDRFINLHLSNNTTTITNNNNNNPIYCISPVGGFNPIQHQAAMPIDSAYNVYNHPSFGINNDHERQQESLRNSFQIDNASIMSNNFYGNIPFDNSANLNLNNNQCSKPIVANSTAPNVFNLCNPLAMNLNGVTEQIGNLHL